MIEIKKTKTQKAANGYIVYQGPSVLNPLEDIIAIATYNSANAKTGNMVQLWIFADGEHSPHETAAAPIGMQRVTLATLIYHVRPIVSGIVTKRAIILFLMLHYMVNILLIEK